MGYDINTFTMSFIRNKVATFNGKSYKRKGHLYLIKIKKRLSKHPYLNLPSFAGYHILSN